jgi:hypothetical protein
MGVEGNCVDTCCSVVHILRMHCLLYSESHLPGRSFIADTNQLQPRRPAFYFPSFYLPRATCVVGCFESRTCSNHRTS